MTKKELDKWHSNVKNFKKMQIVPDKEKLSDIILVGRNKKPNIFLNCQTKKESKNADEVICHERNYLIFDLTENKDIVGIYGKYDKEHDIFYIAFYNLTFLNNDQSLPQWTEMPDNRIYISRNYESNASKVPKKILEQAVDICGQYNGKNSAFVGLKKEFISFCNGPFLLRDTYGSMVIASLSTAKEIEFIFEKMENGESLMKRCWLEKILYFEGSVNRNRNIVINRKDNAPICKEAYERLKMFAMAAYNSKQKDACLHDYINGCSWSLFSILENMNGQMTQRIFVPIFFVNDKTPEVDLYEVGNIVYTKETCDRRDYDLSMIMTKSIPVWMDENTENTVFEYSSYIINDAIDFMLEAYESVYGECDTEKTLENILRRAGSKMGGKYHITINCAVKGAVEIGSDSTFEAFLNFQKESQKEYIKQFKMTVFEEAVVDHAYFAMNMYLGALNLNSDKLHEKLMVPKSLLKYAFDNDCISILLDIKRCFSHNMNYFIRLNESDVKYLYDFFHQFVINNDKEKSQTESDEMFNFKWAFQTMTEVFGVKSWKSYINFLSAFTDMEKQDEFNKYRAYLEVLTEASLDLKQSASWKLSGEALDIVCEELMHIFKMQKTSEYERMVKIFNEKQNKWQKYVYEDENYIIVLPQAPDDIIKEGLMLSHCVKSFMQRILNDKSIILFIRKKEAADIPFFTLEIRNGQVMQCHGKANIDVETPELKKFMEGFCISNEMVISYGEKRFGAH